ncbi:hypothetical protein KR093_010461, partial [Drosophila rubida]
RKSPEQQKSKNCNDAGNDKMASPSITIKRLRQPGEHELRIMEVGCASITEEPAAIELNDESIEVDNMTLASELQTVPVATNNNNSETDALQSVRFPAKPEAISDVESSNSYHGPDPMGLLQRIDANRNLHDGVEDDDDDEDDEDDDEETDADVDGEENSSIASHNGNDAERWQSWMKRWPWVLHEESDGDFAFCLYCNVVINVNRHISYVQQHNLSLYHQERENNYVAFKNSEKQTVSEEHEVKYELGSNEYIKAMKKKRVDEVDALNNFNWERWLKWHSWLERIQPSGTIGLCKCCNIRMNVEFVYLRKRHEISKGHRDALRQQEIESNASRKRKRSASPVNMNAENEPEARSSSAKRPFEDASVPAVVDSGVETADPSDFCELLPDTTPQQCRCTVCDCRMAISSFMRHLKTKVHCNNLQSQRRNSLSKLERGIWAQYGDKHPWLVADPKDPTMAYCHVCSRRFMYGHSEIKRKTHENSEKHQAALTAAGTTNIENPSNETNSEQSESEESSAESDSVGSDEDYVEADARLSTSKTSPVGYKERTNTVHKSKQMVRHYSWLRYTKDRKTQICKYCRVRFHSESNKSRHELTTLHKKLVQQFNERKAARLRQVEKQRKLTENPDDEEEDQSNSDADASDAEEKKVNTEVKITAQVQAKATSRKPVSNRVPTSMHGKVMVWKDRFPWLSYKRAEQRSNYGWCKLCEVSVFIPSFKIAAKHQRSSRHVRLRLERKRRAAQIAAGGVSMATATAAALATGEAKHKAAMAELQAKYSWLEADATDENHCHCKICDARLPIKVFYLRQHDGSRKHADHVERLKNSSETAAAPAVAEEPQQTNMDVDQDSDGALSVKSEDSTLEQSGSKRSRRSADMRRVLRALRASLGKRNEERSQIDMAKDMICSSFDIVHRLRALERGSEASSASPMRPQAEPQTIATPARDTIDLFLDSISQTMKTLPSDLAAEGKVKIMQIVCNLELRNIRRTQTDTAATNKQPDSVAMETTENVAPSREDLNDDQPMPTETIEAIPDSPESASSSVVIDEQFNEAPTRMQLQRVNSNQTVNSLSDVTPTTTQRMRHSLDDNPSKGNAATTTSATVSNGRSKEVPVNIRRILPSTVQVGSKPEQLDKVRVVSMDKLTNPVPNQNNNTRNSGNVVNLNAQSQQKQQQINRSSTINTPTSSTAAKYAEINNAAFIRKIRLNNGVATKVVPYQRAPQNAQEQRQSSPTKKQQSQ